MQEYDAAVRAGKSSMIHRVAHRLFKVGLPIRNSFNDFFGSVGQQLQCFSYCFIALQEYALCTCVSRRMEALFFPFETYWAAVHFLFSAILVREVSGVQELKVIGGVVRVP